MNAQPSIIIDTREQLRVQSINPKMYTSKGRLTRYALSCGYVERYVFQSARYTHEVRMHMEHNVIFVRCEHGDTLYSGNDLQQARCAFDAERNAIRNTFRA